MTAMDAEAIYAAGGPSALRLSTRGAVNLAIREGRADDILTDVAVPLARLADLLRQRGEKAAANGVLEHAVHDGVRAVVLAQAISMFTTETVVGARSPAPLSVGPHGGLMAGPPPPATDAASTAALANYMRSRLLSFEA